MGASIRPMTWARVATGLLLVGLTLPGLGPAQQAPESPKPQTQPTPATLADRFRSLDSLPESNRGREERALLAGLRFCLLVGVGDGPQAAELLDAAGYQPLPLTGDLPRDPARLVSRDRFIERLAQRPESNVDRAPAGRFRLIGRAEAREQFRAAGEWMLPKDHMLVIEPAGGGVKNWVARKACLVIRSRGSRAAIMGGNLLAALETAGD